MKLTKKNLLVAAACAAAVGAPALASHSWNNYHWSRTGAEITVPVIDHTTGVWATKNHTGIAVTDWNKSTVIQSPLTRGSGDPSCPITAGQIDVCNDNYGDNGWLGIASITITRGRDTHITGGVSKMNDFYFNQAKYNNDTWRQLVMCQEIGHDYGLGHQDEDFATDNTASCMDYTSLPEGNEHPDAHDYEQLLTIYSHSHSSSSGPGGGPKIKSGTNPADWGRAVDTDARGRPNVYIRVEGKYYVVTHVTWAIGMGPTRGGHRR